jgi:hypothetical protein
MKSMATPSITPAIRRKIFIFAALVLSLWASWQVSQEPEPESSLLPDRTASKNITQAARTKAKSDNAIMPEQLAWPQPLTPDAAVVDVFSPPAPVMPKAAILPMNLPPPAPVFKYKYIGRLEGSYNDSIFLSDDAQRVTTAVAGQNLNDGWKLLSVDSQKLVFLHTATGAENTMIIGTSQ